MSLFEDLDFKRLMSEYNASGLLRPVPGGSSSRDVKHDNAARNLAMFVALEYRRYLSRQSGELNKTVKAV